jgi:tetratricopeptide (TPR) repeat protein
VNAADSRSAYLARELERALALHQRGQIAPAQRIYEQILKLQAAHVDALHLLGVIAAQTGHPQRAVELIGKSIALDPTNAVAHFNIASSLQELKRWEAALASYDRAIALDPGFAEAFSNRGVVLKDLKRLDAALESCERAISIRAEFAEAHFNRGVVLQELKRLDAALVSYEHAVALRSDYAEAHFNRGAALSELGRSEAALVSYDQAIAHRSDYVLAHVNRGNVLKELGRLDAALASYDRALAADADCLGAHLNRAILLLLLGRFEGGWREYEWRWRREQRLSTGVEERILPQPLWLGEEPIAGRKILLHAEQGLGDTIQFCRYAQSVAALGATVILEVQEPLLELLGGLAGVARLVAPGGAPPDVDYHCPLMSLPLVFKTTLESIPARIPYLCSSADKVLHWRAKLGERGKLRVGLVWAGGFRAHQPELWAVTVNARRNIPLAELAALNDPNVEFYSLQKGEPAQSEAAELRSKNWNGPALIDHTNQLHDFSDTAALIENLDLVISVDTATAHLAGAMGKPVWILNRFDSCWRWLLDRSDSPWYPTVRLFRQERPGDWNGVVHRVKLELARRASRFLRGELT